MDRNELGALLVAAGLGPPAEHALISLLALNGLRVSEATGADIEHLGLERGHRTLTITRKGGKVVTIPLAPRTARAIDLAIGERTDGPVFLAADGRRLDRHGAGRIVRKVARRAGITKAVTPHTLRHTFITAALDAGVPLRDVQEAASHTDPRITMRQSGLGAAWTGTPHTSSPRISRAPPGGQPGRSMTSRKPLRTATSTRARTADMRAGRCCPRWLNADASLAGLRAGPRGTHGLPGRLGSAWCTGGSGRSRGSAEMTGSGTPASGFPGEPAHE